MSLSTGVVANNYWPAIGWPSGSLLLAVRVKATLEMKPVGAFPAAICTAIVGFAKTPILCEGKRDFLFVSPCLCLSREREAKKLQISHGSNYGVYGGLEVGKITFRELFTR